MKRGNGRERNEPYSILEFLKPRRPLPYQSEMMRNIP
jgi:hypothetical protein